MNSIFGINSNLLRSFIRQSHFSLFHQILRFGIVGLLAAILHFLVVILLVQYGFFSPLIANIFALFISFQLSYWGHRLWTFQDTITLHREAFPKLIAIQLLNFSANEFLFYLFLTFHLPYQIALLIVLTILPVFTFFSNKFWVFR